MSYFYDDDDVQSVKDSTNIVDVISEYVQLKRAGQNYKGLCPFHSEKTPSFVVSPDKNMFHCFGCGAGGDAIAFLMKYNNMDFVEAIEDLASRANIELKKKESSYNKEKIDRNRKFYTINREAAIYFFRNLKKDKKALFYLQKRGIDNNIVDRFAIGYAGESWSGLLDYLLKKGYTQEDIDAAGLLSKSRDGEKVFDRFRGRIMFPIWDVKDRMIGFGGRLITEQGSMPKYLNSPDTPVFLKGNNLYGLNKARDSIREKGYIILVEGYMDVIALSIHGINNCAASLGTALTPEQIKLIKRYTDNIVISYDSDSAGKNAAVKAAVLIKQEGLSPKIVELDDGMDPDEFLEKYTTDEYRKRVKESKHFMDFIIDFNKANYNMNSTEERLKFINVICRYLSIIKSPVELDIYIGRLAEESGVSEDAVRKELESMKRRQEIRDNGGKRDYRGGQQESRPQERRPAVPTIPDKSAHDADMERMLLNIILKVPSFISDCSDMIKPDRFKDSTNRKVYEALLDIFRSGESNIAVNVDSLSPDISERAKEIEQIEQNIDDSRLRKAFEDIIRMMELNYNKSRKKELLSALKSLSSSEASESLSPEERTKRELELLVEIQRIDEVLKKFKDLGGLLDA